MNMPEMDSNPWWDDSVEAFVDASLSEKEMQRLDELLSVESHLAEEVELARAIQQELNTRHTIQCPDYVMERVMREVRNDLVLGAGIRFRHAVKDFLGSSLRPALAMTVLLAMVITAALFGGSNRQTDPAVAEALEEVKWTLAYLSEISRHTGSAVRTQALEPLVLDRMQKAMDTFIEN